jgi:hypothetical protein
MLQSRQPRGEPNALLAALIAQSGTSRKSLRYVSTNSLSQSTGTRPTLTPASPTGLDVGLRLIVSSDP